MAEAVKTAYMRLQRVLMDADEIQRKKGLKRGKLNGKALHRLQVDNDRVFSKRLRGVGVRQFAFSIVVDQSCSMGGRKIEEARNSAYVIAETLDKLHIQFSLTGFNYSHKIINYNYKDFGDSWSNRKESLRYMRSNHSNMDCHSITEVYKSLM
jgi:cobalamin biosynthesis protein CobT